MDLYLEAIIDIILIESDFKKSNFAKLVSILASQLVNKYRKGVHQI
ncbi:hypothetical protein BCE_2985 [Bacillus cereus ATCC 10987]|uniref:Uncharacterized protein n=1 Tax=Bacillus cereus (strain ATCC 10987 / NRS 248) TaxID=222523 RepID=Q736B6_BACC1|nr:hypothetical protein BCE_2985 [Bacillus cereus ATCC 10987]